MHAAAPWVIAALLLFSVFEQTFILFEATPTQVTANVYGANSFPEAQKVANFIRADASPGASIVVLGSEPEIDFYTGLRAATPFLYTYPLMEAHPAQAGVADIFPRRTIYQWDPAYRPRSVSHLVVPKRRD